MQQRGVGALGVSDNDSLLERVKRQTYMRRGVGYIGMGESDLQTYL